MNHPGIIFTILWLLVLGLSPSLLEWPPSDADPAPAGYVCPPCGCSGHDRVYEQAGCCIFCNMPLIESSFPRLKVVEWVLYRDDFFSYFHHKLFYPAYFLAIFLGLFTVWRYKQDRRTIYFMIFFLSFIFYAFKSQLAGTGHSMHLSRRWFFFPGTFLLAAGPALWLYVQTYAQKSRPFSTKQALHFLPAALVFILTAVLFLGKASWRDLNLYNSFDHYPAWAEQFVFLCSGTFYGLRSYSWVRQQQGQERAGGRWFTGLLTAHGLFVLVWALMFGANFLLYHNMATSLEYHWIWLYTALFALSGTYMIIFRRALLFPPPVKGGKDHRLAKPEMEACKDRLLTLMEEEKPYLDPELNLQGLADCLNIKEKELSELLNSGLETNFYQFVNTYRLEEVRKLLLDPDKQHLTNLAIAQEAGFSSRSTFFHLFKKHFGTTPGAFKRENG